MYRAIRNFIRIEYANSTMTPVIVDKMESANNDDVDIVDNSLISRVLCPVDAVKVGEMKEFIIENQSLILVNHKNKFYMIGGKCTHRGASLINGVCINGRIRCPWHSACFEAKTGDIEDFPAIDSLPTFQVKVKDNHIVLLTTMDELRVEKRTKYMEKLTDFITDPIIIIGGGIAGAACAETLRQEGCNRRIVVISNEDVLPYDRSVLSKNPDATIDKIQLRSDKFYLDNSIEFMLNTKVTAVNSSQKFVTVESSHSLTYSKLIIATGSLPYKLHCVGANLNGIYYLRTYIDANNILKAIEESLEKPNVVIFGSSFITSICSRAASITIIGHSDLPLPFFGDQIGIAVQKLFESFGVRFYADTIELRQFHGTNGRVDQVLLKNRESLPADIVIVGIGIIPATGFLNRTGVYKDECGFIVVNESMQSNVTDIYAIGDIASFPTNVAPAGMAKSIVNINHQHYKIAQTHAKICARAIMGKSRQPPAPLVTFFWSSFFGKTIRYCGLIGDYDETIGRGDFDKFTFIVYYFRKSKLIAVASCGQDRITALFADIFEQSKIVISKADVIKNTTDDWQPMLAMQ